jgi:hypothetical protein
VLFVAGEKGLGKTSVLDHACTLGSASMCMVTARADSMESSLPFGLLIQAF